MHYDENTKQIQPTEDLVQIFDIQKENIKKIHQQLKQQLVHWKKQLNVSKASYVSVRAKKQIEVPLDEVKNKKYTQLIFSSQTSKFIRYTTAKINDLSEQLAVHERKLARSYEPFCSMIVKQFCSHKLIWQLYLNAIAKLDVLISLAKTSKQMDVKTLPIFKCDVLKIQKGMHPGLFEIKEKQKIVGNHLKLEGKQKILLLTGPNMGGKSTLLRQTCLLAIIAQIGCYVPCQHYETIVFDQIFCRIGASDRIIQGKSTFYVQLEETKRIIDQATPQSLIIIDQLGRGTSTYDGMSLASAVLKYIMNQIQCFTLFSTHYFPITQQYKNNEKILCSKIGYCFQKQKIRFTYQLQKGVAQKSFANQVAAFAGISEQVIMLANQKAVQLQNNQKNKYQKNREIKFMLNKMYNDLFLQNK